jgi:hypothetical protein
MPLVGMEAVAGLLGRLGVSLKLHSYVLLELPPAAPTSDPPPPAQQPADAPPSTSGQTPLPGRGASASAAGRQVWLFDFLPLRPTSPATALILLTGGGAPGEARCRRLPALPPGARCVGSTSCEDPLAVALRFNGWVARVWARTAGALPTLRPRFD